MKIKWMSTYESSFKEGNRQYKEMLLHSDVELLVEKAKQTNQMQYGWTGNGYVLVLPSNPLVDEAKDHDKFDNVSVHFLNKVKVFGIPK